MKRIFTRIVACTLLIAFAVIMALMLGGCNPVKKLDALFIQQPAEAARLSNLVYPCFKGPLKSDTVITMGKPDTTVVYTSIRPSTLFSNNDSLKRTATAIGATSALSTGFMFASSGPATLTGVKTVTIKVPVIKTVTDTLLDNRQNAALQAQLKSKGDSLVQVKTQLSLKKKQANIELYILIGIGVIVLVVIAVKIYKLISGGAVANTAGAIIKKL